MYLWEGTPGLIKKEHNPLKEEMIIAHYLLIANILIKEKPVFVILKIFINT